MNLSLRVLIAQMNPKVGAIEENLKKITDIILEHQENHDLILFPELCLSGYPPEDILFLPSFQDAIDNALKKIQDITTVAHVIIGHPSTIDEKRHNSASIFHQGLRLQCYHKQKLPNYGVFDELRYFTPGPKETSVFKIKGYKLGLCICEDLWQQGPGQDLIDTRIDALISLNASPYDSLKQHQRERLMRYYAKQGTTLIYINMVGAQDELIFDGQSFVMSEEGEIYARLPAFKEMTASMSLFDKKQYPIAQPLEKSEEIYKALVLAVKEYIEKNQFPGVLIGLSGGIDSALTLCIAVDALGPSRVKAVMMPSRFTAKMSIEDALKQIETLKISSEQLSIEPLFEEALQTLKKPFEGYSADTTEENIQARLRGLLLMALSNKTGHLVLTTSNKSEMAVGYSTLYGDMAGGFCVLKDVLKTEVYELAAYRNRQEEVIPQRVIDRAPSAELAENQRDQDSLPDYPILDAMIRAYVEKNLPLEKMITDGMDKKLIERIIHLIHRAEYKRRQGPIGPKISPTAFGRDWRFPITNTFYLEMLDVRKKSDNQ